MMDLEKRYLGCLAGLAVGDAFGSPMQYMTEPQIQIKLGTVREMIGGGWLLLRPGQPTDETALALLLGQSLVDRGGLDPEDVARRYVKWYRGGPKELTGVLRTSLALLADGIPAEEAAGKSHELTGEDPADNTTLMRCAPLTLFFGARIGELFEAAAREAAITHWDARAVAGSVALCAILASILDGLPREEIPRRAFGLLERRSGGLPNVLPDVSTKQRCDLRPRPHVVDTLETAFHHFLHCSSFEETVIRTGNLGGASDSTTAAAGAMAGAYWGADAIPRRWLRPLAGRTAIGGLAREIFRCRREAPEG